MRPETMKLLEEGIEGKLLDFSLAILSLDLTPKANVTKTNKLQRDILEAINAKITLDISQMAILKLEITFTTLIDRVQNMILKQTEGPDAELTPEAIGMADKCMQWAAQLIDLTKDTYSRNPDPERSLSRLVEKIRAELTNAKIDSDNNNSDDTQLINDIVERLRKSYN